MTSTTLVTFLLQTPRHANRVELLGSWDNFSRPYAMRRDRNVGSGHWRGCHSFTDIVCDGDTIQAANGKRDGALLMGGKYWYFYRLDDDLEYCNPTEPSTSACPLLPGQSLNVLEVPFQMAAPDDPDMDAPQELCKTVFTLDPEDKYRNETASQPHAEPRRAASSIGSNSLTATSGSGIGRPLDVEPLDFGRLNDNLLQLYSHGTDGTLDTAFMPQISQSLPCSRRSSMRSRLKGLRRCLSRSETPKKEQIHPTSFRGWFQRDRDGPTSADTRGESIPAYYTDAREFASQDSTNLQELRQMDSVPSPLDKDRPKTTTANASSGSGADTDSSKILSLTAALKSSLDLAGPSMPTMPDRQAENVITGSGLRDRMSWLKLNPSSTEAWSHGADSPSNKLTESLDQATERRSDMARKASTKSAKPKHLSFISSNRTSGVFSFSSSMSFSTEPSSPAQHVSQPITPTLEGFFESPVYCTAPSQPPNTAATTADQQADEKNAHRLFPGYSLPAEDYSSVQTLRPQGSGDKDASNDFRDAAQHVSASPQNRTALQELVDDMGYLGAIIG